MIQKNGTTDFNDDELLFFEQQGHCLNIHYGRKKPSDKVEMAYVPLGHHRNPKTSSLWSKKPSDYVKMA